MYVRQACTTRIHAYALHGEDVPNYPFANAARVLKHASALASDQRKWTDRVGLRGVLRIEVRQLGGSQPGERASTGTPNRSYSE